MRTNRTMSSSIPIPMNRIHRLEYLVSQLTSKTSNLENTVSALGSTTSIPTTLSINTTDATNTLNIKNVSSTTKALNIRNAADSSTLCTIDNNGAMVLNSSVTASNAFITVANVPYTNVATSLETLDGDVTTLEGKVAALAQALTDAGILASTAFGASLAYTLASTVVLGSSVVYKDTNASLLSLTLKAPITMTIPAASFSKGGTNITCSFAVTSPVAGTTYQQYLKFGNDGGSGLYGGYLAYGVVANTGTFSSYGVLFGGAVKEAIRLYTTAGTNIFVGINNTIPTSTLDIVNRVSTVNALNI